ncbi:PIN domain-containing protein [Halorubraceae archaeon YAN]|nr:PIN domain-containing protein [Halorubraceae archaeon YAN]
MIGPDTVESVVFDTEPLVAHADGETGADIVTDWLDAVYEGEINGHISTVNLTEVKYILARKYSRQDADEYISWLSEMGIHTIPAGQHWDDAAEWILNYNPALGDSYALATAENTHKTETALLVGADDDYDDIEADSPKHFVLKRFRTEPA